MANAMKNYLSNVRARMTNPLRIRIGGNGMDSSTYVPTQTNMITETDPDAYYNDIPVDFGPTFFDVLNAMAEASGAMQEEMTKLVHDLVKERQHRDRRAGWEQHQG